MTHLLALTAGGTTSHFQISGTPLILPSQINNITLLSGAFGGNLVKLGVDLFFFAAILLAFVFIAFGGFKWMTSQGDKKKIEEARNTIIFSLIGFIVMSLAFLTISILGAFFKVPLISK